MDGEINETYLSDLHSRRTDNNQSSFSDFTNTSVEDIGTAIAVVTDPTGGIVENSDEFMPELGMPENELNNFRAYRSSLDVDDDVRRHNLAVEQTEIEESYREHLQSDSKAKETLREIAGRVRNGEKITLVCFEKDPKWCHRHILLEEIEKLVNSPEK